jgi:uncharacterized protein
VQIEASRVLLTGATGGLGRAIAKALDERGARLLLTGRSQDALDALCREFGDAEGFAADLAKREDVAALPGRVGAVDILVSNAGLPASGTLDTFTSEEIDRGLDVNLRAGIMLTHALLPGMLERGRGHLVYISSMAGKVAPPRASVYAATKYGLRGFALALGDDLDRTPVGVSVVFPGPIEEAGMQADTGVRMPSGVPRRYPRDVAAAVVKAIEKERPEIDVADPVQEVGVLLAQFSPRLLRWGKRMSGVYAIADRTVAAQRVKR